MKKEVQLASTNGKNQLHVICWIPQGEIRAIMQISHGMIEYIDRYEAFAQYLNLYGILVIGNDHLGHGQTAKNSDEFGFFGDGKSVTVVNDLFEVTKYAKREFGRKCPYYLFGHSMGSFMARRYLMTYGKEIDGAIICGTGQIPGGILKIGIFVAKTIQLFRGERYRSTFLKQIAFHSYNKKVEHLKSENDWLSRDEENVEAYNKDPFCTFCFTVNGYLTLFEVLTYIQKRKNYNKIPCELPVFMIAGEEDPVGNYGKGVIKVYQKYQKMGIKDIRIKLYEKDRHEIVNEADRFVVYDDVRDWLNEQISIADKRKFEDKIGS